MNECVIRYYISTKTEPPRILRFERKAVFQSVPHAGSMVDLEEDYLEVESTIFVENGPIILRLENVDGLDDSELDSTIDEMTENGWTLRSNCQREITEEYYLQ